MRKSFPYWTISDNGDQFILWNNKGRALGMIYEVETGYQGRAGYEVLVIDEDRREKIVDRTIDLKKAFASLNSAANKK